MELHKAVKQPSAKSESEFVQNEISFFVKADMRITAEDGGDSEVGCG